jgi:hypothetical protein
MLPVYSPGGTRVCDIPPEPIRPRVRARPRGSRPAAWPPAPQSVDAACEAAAGEDFGGDARDADRLPRPGVRPGAEFRRAFEGGEMTKPCPLVRHTDR